MKGFMNRQSRMILLPGLFGRLRDVAQGSDGFLYILTSDTDAYGPGRRGGDLLLRIVPRNYKGVQNRINHPFIGMNPSARGKSA